MVKHKIIVILFWFALTSTLVWGNAQQQPKPKHGDNIHFDPLLEMTIAPCGSSFDILYHPKPKLSLKEVAEKNGYRYIINGSYYNRVRGNCIPAGWFNYNGKILGKFSRGKVFTHVVQYNLASKEFQFIPQKFFNHKKRYGVIEFQTGPLIISNGKVVKSSAMNTRIHNGQYTRTFLAVRDKVKAYFITVRTPVSLDDAAEALMKTELVKKGNVSIICIESGEAVAFYAADKSEYNFNHEDVLPILFCTKK